MCENEGSLREDGKIYMKVVNFSSHVRYRILRFVNVREMRNFEGVWQNMCEVG